MIGNIFDRIENIAQCHVKDMEFGRYFCKPGFIRGNTNTGACSESNFAQNQPGFNLSGC